MLSISTAPLFKVKESSYILIFFFNSSFYIRNCSLIEFVSFRMEKDAWDLSLLVRSSSSWSFMLLIASVSFSFSHRSLTGNVNGKWNLSKWRGLLFLFFCQDEVELVIVGLFACVASPEYL